MTELKEGGRWFRSKDRSPRSWGDGRQGDRVGDTSVVERPRVKTPDLSRYWKGRTENPGKSILLSKNERPGYLITGGSLSFGKIPSFLSSKGSEDSWWSNISFVLSGGFCLRRTSFGCRRLHFLYNPTLFSLTSKQ